MDQQDQHYCRNCGYDLRGQTENRCPECGSVYKPDDPATFAESPPSGITLRLLISPLCNRYVLTGLILSITAAVYLVARNHTLSQKLPLPLKAPLSQLDEERLLPYRFGEAILVEQDILDQLGTSEYVDWILEEPGGQGRRLSLFVTYYTGAEGLQARISPGHGSPRIRVVCQKHENVTITSRGKNVSMPLGVVEFEQSGENPRRWVVVSIFHANGGFAKDRSGVRQIISGSADRHAYFAKVEAAAELDLGATQKEAVESVKRFLQVIIPVLLEDHLPDWDNRPASPPSWFPWLPATPRPSAAPRPSP